MLDRHALNPNSAILISTLLWGTWWIPLRQLDQASQGGVWLTATGLWLPLLILAPWALPHWRRIVSGGWPLVISGLLLSSSIALYAEAMLRGYVARVILLFYLTCIWSTLFERFMLGQAISPRRFVAIALGLTGIIVMFGLETGFPLPHNIAEWMALISGVLWAWGLVYLRRLESRPVLDKAIVQFLFLGLCFLALAMIPGGRDWQVPELAVLKNASIWMLAVALGWTMPLYFLTLFGAGELNPGRVSILLMFEVAIGIGSAALLTDEPFGMREMSGGSLILLASMTELFPDLRRKTAQ